MVLQGLTWLNTVSDDRWGAVEGMVGIDLGYIAVLWNTVPYEYYTIRP